LWIAFNVAYRGRKKINDKVWYSGIYETNAFDIEDDGRRFWSKSRVLMLLSLLYLLEIGHYRWVKFREQISSHEKVDALVTALYNGSSDFNRILVRVLIEGAV